MRMVKKASSPPAPKKAKVVSAAVKKAETLVKDDGKKVPISSRHDPAYVHAEKDRDAQAQAYLKKLQAIEQAKAAKRAAAHKVAAPVEHRQEDRNAIAEKYLKIMEKQALKPNVSKAKKDDRNVLAQKVLRVCVFVVRVFAAAGSGLGAFARGRLPWGPRPVPLVVRACLGG